MEAICGLLLLLFPLWMIWKRPATMYWICLAFLWLQALAIVFNFNAVYAFVVEGNEKKGESILPLAILSCLCFLLPLAAAGLTALLTGAYFLGIPCFLLYSIIQTAILGAKTGQIDLTKRSMVILQGFLPILGFIVTLIRLIHPLVELFGKNR